MNKKDKIVILGITGYMGSWLAASLTQLGFTNLTGTFHNSQKFASLTQKLPNVRGVRADMLTEPTKILQALQGAKWVFNDTAPFTGEERAITDFVTTKLKAVNNLFWAISQVKSVEKLVHIGSIGAIGYGNTDPHKTVFTEADWTDVTHMDYPYDRFAVMKVKEEKRIWDLSHILGLKTTIIHPTNVIGPSFLEWNHDMINAYLKNRPYLVDGPMDSVDVRDIAGLQIDAMEKSQFDGKRVMGLGFTLNFSELLKIVRAHLTKTQIERLFISLPQLITVDEALFLWSSVSYTSFYKDQAPRLQKKAVYRTMYPGLYTYQYTDPQPTINRALDKMLESQHE
ncbi:NAD-dependent epimerase/dehydratase family protein [Pediococcus siamensis]|uniref:NAD-dependent epimerase/dehydratase family protein n=1 Tax=Pediococcus siamensis TaxID=381829 RepID=UPI0039A37077